MSTGAVLLQPYCNPLTKCILHSFGSLVLHVKQHVAVGIQGYGDAGVDSGDNLLQYRCGEGSVMHIYLSPEHAGQSTTSRGL